MVTYSTIISRNVTNISYFQYQSLVNLTRFDEKSSEIIKRKRM